MYTFLSNNAKFREYSSKFWAVVMMQLLSIVFCSFALLASIAEDFIDGSKVNILDKLATVQDVLLIIFAILFIVSWLYLCKIFYIIYGSLYHLRKKRFLKYTKMAGWFYEKFFHKSFYETNYRERKNFKLSTFKGLSDEQQKRIKEGGIMLLLYHDNADYTRIVSDFIIETISAGETIDYFTTYKSPIEMCRTFSDDQIQNVAKKLSIIDSFSPHYAFDDKVVKFAKDKYSKKGFMFYNADSFAEIHTAANDSWYRFRKVCEEEEKNEYRIPHRTVYDTLSSLIRFSSEEQYFVFLRHVASSEKSYGMITVIIEPLSLKDDLRNDLIRMADTVIEYSINGMRITK